MVSPFKNNAKDTNYFTKKFTNCWCDEWFLINEKVIIMVDLNENNKRLATSTVCKNVVK